MSTSDLPQMTEPSFPSRPNDSGSVRSTFADGVATLEFAHPKGNSLPAALLRRLAEEIEGFGHRADAHVILLRSGGEGPFCAGASFDELKAIRDAKGGKEFFMGFARLILAMKRCPKLIVTRVQGKVVGGGVGIVAASDYAMATESGALRLSELAVGIGPFVVGPVIERKIGLAAFTGMAVDADWRPARWAERLGLYAAVFDGPRALDAAVDVSTRKLAASNPEAMTKLKEIFWHGTDDWPERLEERAEMSGSLVLSDFTRRAIAAFQGR